MIRTAAAVAASLLALPGLSAQESPPIAGVGLGDEVVTTVLADGSVVALGPQWKMIVGAQGAKFVPVLGEKAPRTLPIRFGLPQARVAGAGLRSDAGVPVLDGRSARVDHGAIVEVYAFAPKAVEQSFVIEELPARGELTLTLPIETELAGRDTAGGLVFDVPGFGTIAYGDATIVDARGRKVGAESRVVGGAIEIRVPESFVRAAKLPLVVDPMIVPDLDIEVGSSTSADPDVAFDGVHHTFLVVYERANASNEHDILCNPVNENGAILATKAVEASDEDTVDPSVCDVDLNQTFFCAWLKNKSGVLDDIQVQGCAVSAGGSASSVHELSPGSDNESHPVVGGADAGANLVIAWQENPAIGGGGENIAARLFNVGSSTLGSKIDVADGSADEVLPTVNKHSVDNSWLIAYEVQNSASESDIRCAVKSGSSFVVFDGPIAVSAIADDVNPAVTQIDTDTFLVLWQRNQPSLTGNLVDSDILAARFHRAGSTIAAETAIANLTDLETPGEDSIDQTLPRVSRNPTRVAYTFHVSAENQKLSSFDFDGPAPVVLEKSLAILGSAENVTELAALGNGGFGDTFLVVGTEVSGTNNNILAQFFESDTAGGVTKVQTGCGGVLEPKLDNTPVLVGPLLCEPFSIKLTGFTNALMAIGTPATIPLCPGQGGCVLGATPTILQPFANGTFTFTLPCDPTLFAVNVAMTGVDLIGPAPLSGACGPPKFSQFFRTSDTLVLDFQ